MSIGHHTYVTNSPAKNIHYVRRHEIDTDRWDDCVAGAANSILYGFHYYLDHMAAGNWDALILGDYEAIMPLTWRRKFGICYLYQPPFTQQAGIFSAKPLSTETIAAFLQTARKYFRFAEIFLNYGNEYPGLPSRVNYVLSLDATYARLAANYKKELVRNLRLADDFSLTYSPATELHQAIQAFRSNTLTGLPTLNAGDFNRFEELCKELQTRGQLILRAVTNADAQTLALTLLALDGQRLYLLLPTTFDAGRKARANHFLVDSLIREYAGKPLLLDFEGSDIPGIGHFYANFGALRQPYFFYRYNHLPWPISWLKR